MMKQTTRRRIESDEEKKEGSVKDGENGENKKTRN